MTCVNRFVHQFNVVEVQCVLVVLIVKINHRAKIFFTFLEIIILRGLLLGLTRFVTPLLFQVIF